MVSGAMIRAGGLLARACAAALAGAALAALVSLAPARAEEACAAALPACGDAVPIAALRACPDWRPARVTIGWGAWPAAPAEGERIAFGRLGVTAPDGRRAVVIVADSVDCVALARRLRDRGFAVRGPCSCAAAIVKKAAVGETS